MAQVAQVAQAAQAGRRADLTVLEVSRSLPRTVFRVDIMVRSRETLERRKKLGDWFLREITAKGKVLYERDN